MTSWAIVSYNKIILWGRFLSEFVVPFYKVVQVKPKKNMHDWAWLLQWQSLSIYFFYRPSFLFIHAQFHKYFDRTMQMMCEECGHFLEIAEAIKSLGLTILKGVTEAHGEKTWICFVVEVGSHHYCFIRYVILLNS